MLRPLTFGFGGSPQRRIMASRNAIQFRVLNATFRKLGTKTSGTFFLNNCACRNKPFTCHLSTALQVSDRHACFKDYTNLFR